MNDYKQSNSGLKKPMDWRYRFQRFTAPSNIGLKPVLKCLDPMRKTMIPTRSRNLKKTVPDTLEKITTPCLERYSTIRYWTQDESRFGLKTITRRRITLKGVKPLV